MLGTAHKIEVDAPDGAAALELEHRLYARRPTTIFSRGRWVVDLPGVHDTESVEAEVRDWLRQVGAGATTMRIDGQPVTVVPKARSSHRSSHADFIG